MKIRQTINMATNNNLPAVLSPRYQPVTADAMLGGFGSVLPVVDIYLGRTVLFKSMQDPAHNAQLLNEIQNLSKARSRHVVEIYDVLKDEAGNVAGIVIEYLKGRDYLDFHKEAIGNPDGYLRVLYQIATALKDLHSFGIVHRDLKLDNLRSSTSGIVKLFDFGISSPGDGYYTINNRGTLVYAAPELFVAGAAITPKVDIYAFGVCAWALASPVYPSPLREKPPQSINRVSSLASIFGKNLPSKVVELIDRCLDPIAHNRPTSQELSDELAKYLTRGLHKGVFVRSNAAVYELSQDKDNVRIKIGNLGEIKVAYDGISFRVTGVAGDVTVNNVSVTVGMELFDACVLTFGTFDLGWQREWVTFFSSNPEVIL